MIELLKSRKLKKKLPIQFACFVVKIKSKCGNVLLQKNIRFKINEARWFSYGWYLLSNNNSSINQCRHNEICEWMNVAKNPDLALCNSSSKKCNIGNSSLPDWNSYEFIAWELIEMEISLTRFYSTSKACRKPAESQPWVKTYSGYYVLRMVNTSDLL